MSLARRNQRFTPSKKFSSMVTFQTLASFGLLPHDETLPVRRLIQVRPSAIESGVEVQLTVRIGALTASRGFFYEIPTCRRHPVHRRSARAGSRPSSAEDERRAPRQICAGLCSEERCARECCSKKNTAAGSPLKKSASKRKTAPRAALRPANRLKALASTGPRRPKAGTQPTGGARYIIRRSNNRQSRTVIEKSRMPRGAGLLENAFRRSLGQGFRRYHEKVPRGPEPRPHWQADCEEPPGAGPRSPNPGRRLCCRPIPRGQIERRTRIAKSHRRNK